MNQQKHLYKDHLHVGIELLHDPSRNQGTAFTEEERDKLGIRGLLPPKVFTQAEQVQKVLENLERKPNDLERYILLSALQERNRDLFYRVVIDNMDQIMPIIYTPVVGQACQEYGHIFRRPRGLLKRLNHCLWQWKNKWFYQCSEHDE